LSVADRPREKLIQLGPAALSNLDLIAIILRSRNKTISLMTICRSLIDSIDGNVANLHNLDIAQIVKIKGIGEVKAITLLAAIELGKRTQRPNQPLSLKDDAAVENLIKSYFIDEPKTQYYLVLLNNRDELLATCELETEKGKLPDLEKIMKLSLETGAATMMLCRNEVRLPARFCDQEKAFVIQLDAAASMLKINMRRLLIVEKKARSR
jgi:DNA repair protein RadC